MPEASVIIPSYNHASFIGQAVESVLTQSFQDFELIVVDDGSTDNSLEILTGYRDPRLTVLAQPNQGAHVAINRGLYAATGEYLAILNSDDRFHPLRLAKMIEILKANPDVGLAGSWIDIIDGESKSIGTKHGYSDCPPWALEHPERSFRASSDLHKALLTENYWSTTSNFVFPRHWFEMVGEFRALRFAHDWDYALRTAKMARMVLLPESLIQYRIHATNTIRQDQTAMIFEICWCMAVHLPTHLADQTFLDISTAPIVDEFLNSIYAFGMERVLCSMLLQHLAENQPLASALLDSDDPVRATYLAFIRQELTKNQPVLSSSSDENHIGFLKRAIMSLRRKSL